MLNNKGPLMFINTVNTQIEDSTEQKVFDSRSKDPKKKIDSADKQVNPIKDDYTTELPSNHIEEVYYSVERENRPDFIERRKIKNIIEMYEKDRPVLCNVISNDLEIIGVPFKLEDTNLLIKTKEDHYEKIDINNITDLIIIKF